MHASERALKWHSNLTRDSGQGSFLALICFVSVLWVGLTGAWLSNFAIEEARLQAIADTVAVVASDVRQGLISGFACEVASEVASSNMAILQECLIVGNSASIYVASQHMGIVQRAKARAQPKTE